jgi:dephospho-CoA kinase
MIARPPTSKPYVIGLTGSLAMGKSETAKLFAAEGVMVQDADAAIHALYGKGGAAVPLIAEIFPQAVKDGVVDRAALSAAIVGDPVALARLEALVHPLAAAARQNFLRAAASEEIVVLDVPLLFETGLDQKVDAVVVVSAPPAVQRARAFSRPGMTAEKFAGLLARQLPDVEKRARAHFVIATDQGLDHARAQVRSILAGIREKIHKS